MTPRIVPHARNRCAEMGISTKVAKQIVRHPSLVRPDYPGSDRQLIESDRHPAYAVIYDPDDNAVVTVIFNTHQSSARKGATYTLRESM